MSELRRPNNLARYFVREELRRRGLLQDGEAPDLDAGQEVTQCQK
jgi:hypothetical protein